jgi:5-methyltetrahydropteroyltriglutamate--homocysteine methyltransferase
LISAQCRFRFGGIGSEHLNDYNIRAIQSTIEQLEATGSKIITDGEQTKPSFLTYPISKLMNEYYIASQDCFSLKSVDGHYRGLPRLIKAPFHYATYAHTYIDLAKQFTKLPIK